MVKYSIMSCEKLQVELKHQIGSLNINSLEYCLAIAELDHLIRECISLPASNRATVIRAYTARGFSIEKLLELDEQLRQKAIDNATSYLQRFH